MVSDAISTGKAEVQAMCLRDVVLGIIVTTDLI